MLAMCASALYEKTDVQHAVHQISLVVVGRSVPAVIMLPSPSLKSSSYAGGLEVGKPLRRFLRWELVHAAEGSSEKSTCPLVFLGLALVVLLLALLSRWKVFGGCCCLPDPLGSEILLLSVHLWTLSSHWVAAIVLTRTVVSSRMLSATALLTAAAPTSVLQCRSRLASCCHSWGCVSMAAAGPMMRLRGRSFHASFRRSLMDVVFPTVGVAERSCLVF